VCNRNIAIVIGSSGQIGHFLTDILIDKDYMVYGISRRATSMHTGKNRYFNITCDITQNDALKHVIYMIKPDEFYNLAAVTDSNESIDNPLKTFETNAHVVITLCNILKTYKTLHGKSVKLFQANSIELYKGLVESTIPVNENRMDFYPTTPYGISKLAAYWAVKNDREMSQMFFCSGICTNMESRLRRDTYVIKKISNFHFKRGDFTIPLQLGNVNTTKDWIHAQDAAMAMWLILQHHLPDDYIISTSKHNSIKDFVSGCALKSGLTIDWIDDNCFTRQAGKSICLVTSTSSNMRYFEKRVCEITYSCDKLKLLGWLPEHSSLQYIIDDMFGL
jgi:GDPmannose 4,6-dehydratase